MVLDDVGLTPWPPCGRRAGGDGAALSTTESDCDTSWERIEGHRPRPATCDAAAMVSPAVIAPPMPPNRVALNQVAGQRLRPKRHRLPLLPWSPKRRESESSQ